MTSVALSEAPDLDFEAHYVEHGFAILKRAVEPALCAELLDAVRHWIGESRPLEEWTSDAPGQKYMVAYWGAYSAFDRLFEHPVINGHLADLFGRCGYQYQSTAENQPDRRRLALWVNPFDAEARPRLNRFGHIDSGSPYRGLSFQVCVADTEAHSGNTSFFPGSHVPAHLAVLNNPDLAKSPGGILAHVPSGIDPFEFVAEAGDVALVHHGLVHSGNPSHSKRRRPRIALRIEVFPEHPISVLDPSDPGRSAWERSFPVTERRELPEAIRYARETPKEITV
ncbi:MAG TPA: hypothetical protein VFQ61_36025 [Polyangiaceae bacterium]|nr:hypothetical protein [Polyangiaceae bacterium]